MYGTSRASLYSRRWVLCAFTPNLKICAAVLAVQIHLLKSLYIFDMLRVMRSDVEDIGQYLMDP